MMKALGTVVGVAALDETAAAAWDDAPLIAGIETAALHAGQATRMPASLSGALSFFAQFGHSMICGIVPPLNCLIHNTRAAGKTQFLLAVWRRYRPLQLGPMRSFPQPIERAPYRFASRHPALEAKLAGKVNEDQSNDDCEDALSGEYKHGDAGNNQDKT